MARENGDNNNILVREGDLAPELLGIGWHMNTGPWSRETLWGGICRLGNWWSGRVIHIFREYDMIYRHVVCFSVTVACMNAVCPGAFDDL